MKSLQQTALEYSARHGWSVFPTVDNKKPIFKWKPLQTRHATSDEINKWWDAQPDASIAVITGAISNIIVLDVDGEPGEEEAANRGGELPHTVCSESRPHHRLYYFQHPGYPCGNFAKKIPSIGEVLPGLDLRGDGGFVVAPPSAHHSGTNYYWINAPETTPIATAPDWLLDILQRRHEAATAHETPTAQPSAGYDVGAHLNGNAAYVKAAIDSELKVLAGAAKGERNEQLNKSSFAVGQFVGAGAIDRATAESELARVATSIGMKDSEDGVLPTIRSGLDSGAKKPRVIPEQKKTPVLRQAQAAAYIKGATETEAQSTPIEEEGEEDLTGDDAKSSGPYVIQHGRTLHVIQRTNLKTGEKTEIPNRVCDFGALITQEISDEEGATIFEIEGKTRLKRTFKVECPAATFADTRALAALLSDAAGANCVFYAGQEKHIGPSIKSFTQEFGYARRFNRTGWAYRQNGDGLEFLIPGREDAQTTIQLGRKSPYSIDAAASLSIGLEAFEALLRAQRREMTTVATATAFQAALAYHAGWRDERYALFINGRTGSLKSSWTVILMCLFGKDFQNEDRLIKFGQGATNNAIMDYMVSASDLPFLVDNYKPGTGGGAKDLVNLIHASLEGGEKDRLNRSLKQRAARPVHTWPFFTGEDVPDSDAASMARVLVVPFAWPGGEENAPLTFAQDHAAHLCAVGGAWLEWLEGDDGRAAGAWCKTQFAARRVKWARWLRTQRRDMVNINRVASNLASNELSWEAMALCPALTAIIEEYSPFHAEGLKEVGKGMASYTAESLEANRYLEALRALLATQRFSLVPRTSDIVKEDQGRVIGWIDDDGVYLIPEIAFSEACSMLRESGGLGMVGKNTVHKQLNDLGALATVGSDGAVCKKRCGSKPQRVLHIRTEFLEEKED